MSLLKSLKSSSLLCNKAHNWTRSVRIFPCHHWFTLGFTNVIGASSAANVIQLVSPESGDNLEVNSYWSCTRPFFPPPNTLKKAVWLCKTILCLPAVRPVTLGVQLQKFQTAKVITADLQICCSNYILSIAPCRLLSSFIFFFALLKG